jgi:hypothetical protein
MYFLLTNNKHFWQLLLECLLISRHFWGLKAAAFWSGKTRKCPKQTSYLKVYHLDEVSQKLKSHELNYNWAKTRSILLKEYTTFEREGQWKTISHTRISCVVLPLNPLQKVLKLFFFCNFQNMSDCCIAVAARKLSSEWAQCRIDEKKVSNWFHSGKERNWFWNHLAVARRLQLRRTVNIIKVLAISMLRVA